ncbi:FecCD family ABC transporter permease [Aquipuribacter hungaricus]|uniref:FecCD family ABC transporter permease n=1 Tax=Aquipuribacter hungaricus TaxID=545624 RepID=A0ABV7WE11_9MICO
MATTTAPRATPVVTSAGAVAGRAGVLRRPTGRLLGLLGALVFLGLLALVSLAVGSRPVALVDVVQSFTAFDPTSEEHLVVRSLRVPRTVMAVMVGVALGLAGALMQGLTRNPLADPGILGVSAGAALAVVLAIFVLGVGSLTGYVWAAFAGAAVTSVAVYLLGATGRDGATPVTLALAGAAVTAFLTSLTTAVLLLDVATLDVYRFWAVGSVAGRDLTVAAQVAPFLLVGTVVALASGRSLNALSMGDDVARSLGARVGLTRVVAAVAVVLLVGGATAAAGPIAFVGLTVPHVARAITGPDYRWVLAWSAVLAPVLLVVADVLGRVVAPPGELQVGLVTAVIGAPFFIALVRRRGLAQV